MPQPTQWRFSSLQLLFQWQRLKKPPSQAWKAVPSPLRTAVPLPRLCSFIQCLPYTFPSPPALCLPLPELQQLHQEGNTGLPAITTYSLGGTQLWGAALTLSSAGLGCPTPFKSGNDSCLQPASWWPASWYTRIWQAIQVSQFDTRTCFKFRYFNGIMKTLQEVASPYLHINLTLQFTKCSQ